mgnify:CR=1 FL=1
MERVTHELQPVFNRDSRVLILGTFPSVKSRQQQFYYGHPQNRFWRVTAALLKKEVPVTIEEKKKMLLDGHIEGSSDSSIRNVKANDIGGLLAQTSIRAVFANGDKACQLYRKYCMEQAGREIIRLPSTSPANAAWTLEKLIQAWSVIREYM